MNEYYAEISARAESMSTEECGEMAAHCDWVADQTLHGRNNPCERDQEYAYEYRQRAHAWRHVIRQREKANKRREIASKTTHPGYVPDEELDRGSTKPSRAEVMKNASRDAGKAAKEREAAKRRGR